MGYCFNRQYPFFVSHCKNDIALFDMFDELREFALSFIGTEESFPFGEDFLVFKVEGKMFMVIRLNEHPMPITVKCAPEYALELRETYEAIIPAYHFNKRHWITLSTPERLPKTLVFDLIRNSYLLVLKKLPKVQQERIRTLQTTDNKTVV